ncbi:type II toxin-antitoxin system RelB family antitoxin [Actinomyces faecalis]|uniref:type II toxin-antitoxin system RelB family antitoxin n=1 Tax=Actinomyces faecalis TaxID=2722820 RepID=UPI00155636FB|nr:DUF6290 family protein [Actinomyces faecalis]
MVTSIRLDPQIERRYEALARHTHRSKSFYLRQAIEQAIDRMEFEYRVLSAVEDVRAGRMKTYSLDEAETLIGVDD